MKQLTYRPPFLLVMTLLLTCGAPLQPASSTAWAAEVGVGTNAPIDLGTLKPEVKYEGVFKHALLPRRINVLDVKDQDDANNNELRIVYLGSTLMERASVHGFLESELTRRWPDRELVFRNLAWPGDDVSGKARIGFGPGEERQAGWNPPKGKDNDYGFHKMLGQIQLEHPDLLLIGYGSNVAFADDAGRQEFREGLERLLDTLEPTGARIVLLTPVPRESRPAPWPDIEPQNQRLKSVAADIVEIAAQRGLPVVDLFRAMKPLMTASAKNPPDYLTDNALHLNERGYRAWAHLIAEHFSQPGPRWHLQLSDDSPEVVQASGATIENLQKNRYGLRMQVRDQRLPSLLSTEADQQRVLRVDGLASGSYALDIDGQRVARGTAEQWAKGVAIERGPHIARAERLRSAIVEKNRHFFYGFRPQNETYIFLFRRHERGHHEGEISQFAALASRAEQEITTLRKPPARFYELVREANYNEYSVPQQAPEPDIAEELAAFTVADDLEVSLFASDPMIANPININWDERGRMWVSTSSIYPHLAPGQKPDDKIVVLEDIDGDGRADKSTVFAEDLLIPHSAMPSEGGVFVTQSTDLLYLKDTDQDGRADERRVVFTGFGNADMHHSIHSLRWGPGGDLYFHQSIYINSHIETPWGVRHLQGSGLWRFRTDAMRLDVVSRGLVNPWGNAFDRWGQVFSTDGAGGGGIAYSFAGSAFTSAKGVSRILRSLNPGRPKECGLEILSGRHLDESWRGQFVTADFRANQVVRYELKESGSGYRSRLVGNVLSSKNRSFRPVDVKMGPDGAIYIVDWFSPIIQHGEVDFHHPLRDRKHGRIWRLTAKNRDLVIPPRFADASIEKLLEMLKLPEDWTRDQARRLLREAGARQVVPQMSKWLAELDRQDPDFEHHRLEGLWLAQGLRQADEPLLTELLVSEDHRVRAAAVRVLLDWHKQIADYPALLSRAVQDEHAQVRLEAVNALREIPSLESANVAMLALDRPLDESLEYAVWLAARELSPYWLTAMRDGEPVFDDDPRRLAFALTAVGGRESLEHIRKLLGQDRITAEQRGQMLSVLASEGGETVLGMVVDQLVQLDRSQSPQVDQVLNSLVRVSRSGRARPKNVARLAGFLDSKNKRRVQMAAELSGHWKIDSAVSRLFEIASRESERDALRNSAALALARIEGTGSESSVRSLTQAKRPLPVRVSAYAAWSLIDPVAAARPVVELLASIDSQQPPHYESIFAAFLARERADRKLAEALSGMQLSPAVAATGIRAAGESGRDVSQLIEALTKAGRLAPITGLPAGAELQQLLTAIEQGDPRRGEAIFRRSTMTCIQCHAIGGAGGHVGPDLSSLGGSAQPGKILESILAPSTTIKEGYQTISIYGVDGRVTSGVVSRESPDVIQLRDGKNLTHEFTRSEIDEIVPSTISLMPEGLTQTLRQDELADLIRFLSLLGRPGAFQIPTQQYVRSWQVLVPDQRAARLFESLDELAAALASENLLWKDAASRVDGSLPLDEVATIASAKDRKPRSVLRVTVETPAETAMSLEFVRSKGLTILAGGKQLELNERSQLELEPGKHQLVIVVDRQQREADLRIAIGVD